MLREVEAPEACEYNLRIEGIACPPVPLAQSAQTWRISSRSASDITWRASATLLR